MRAARVAAMLSICCSAAWANDFPTQARVEYVTACMREQPQLEAKEAMYKCSCAVDAIAERMSYDEWVNVSTVANAITIAGERGGAVRDMKDGRKIASSYRDVQADARKRCFLPK